MKETLIDGEIGFDDVLKWYELYDIDITSQTGNVQDINNFIMNMMEFLSSKITFWDVKSKFKHDLINFIYNLNYKNLNTYTHSFIKNLFGDDMYKRWTYVKSSEFPEQEETGLLFLINQIN